MREPRPAPPIVDHSFDHAGRAQLSRRGFLRVGAATTGVLVAAVVMPALLTQLAEPKPAQQARAGVDVSNPRVLFGTPTDLAIAFRGPVWAMGHDNVMRRFERARRLWAIDHICAFPDGATAHHARWARPAGYHQMLLVMADEN